VKSSSNAAELRLKEQLLEDRLAEVQALKKELAKLEGLHAGEVSELKAQLKKHRNSLEEIEFINQKNTKLDQLSNKVLNELKNQITLLQD